MHTILHIGAGEATELDQWLESGAEQIVLVEPNPELAESLRQKTEQHPQVTVLEVAVTANADNNQLHEYNLPEASSLRRSSGLKKLFPGLKLTTTHTVATLAPEQLLTEYGPQQSQAALLVLQVPGEEYAILQSLINADKLKQFSRLHLTANPEPYYEGSTSAKQTLQLLTDHGYDVKAENQQDPDWPVWQLARNPLKDQVTDLQAENAELKAECQALKEELKHSQRKQAELVNEAKAEQAELQQQLGQLQQRLNQAETTCRERTEAERRSVKQLEQLQQQVTDNDESLAELTQQKERFEKRLNEAQRQKSELENAKAYAEAQAADAETKVVNLQGEIAQLLTDLKESQSTHQQSEARRQNERTAEADKQQHLEAKLAEKDRQHSELESRLTETETKLKDAESAFSAKVQAERQVRKQLEQLKHQLAEKDSSHAEQSGQLKAQVVSSQQLLEEQQALTEKQDECLAGYEAQLAETNRKLEGTEAELGQARTSLRQHQDEAEEQKSRLEHRLQETESARRIVEDDLEEARQRLEGEQQARQQTDKSLKEHKEWFLARKQQSEEQLVELADLKQQNEKLEKQLVGETAELNQLRKDLAASNEKLEALRTTNIRLGDLEKQIVGLGSNLTNHLDKKLTNTAKQIEDTMGLQNYLSTGELPLSYHGWPISPDLALYLTEKLETENYDLVIEFGSGTSTVLFAKVLMNKMLRQRAPASQKLIGSTKAAQTSQQWRDPKEPTDADLPKRVLAFEHSKRYYAQTSATLRQAGLDQFVELVHAPLVDYSYQGEDYLYYDCDGSLEQIGRLYYGREPRILVLVDGPPGKTGVNARFPALPKLLGYLPAARLDVLLDDYRRMDEKEVLQKWLTLLDARSMTYTYDEVLLEKGLGLIEIK